MKIMFISDALALWGGIERILSCKAKELVERYGYQLQFVTMNQGSHPVVFPLPKNVEFLDLKIGFHHQYEYSFFRRLLFLAKMNRLCRRRLHDAIETLRPDVIVLITVDFAPVLLRARGRIPFIYESHSSFISDKYDKNGFLTRTKTLYCKYCLRRSSSIVALTQADAKNWKSVSRSVAVIPNIVQLNTQGVYSDCSQKRAIFVGRFTKQKGIGDLLSIWELVYQRFPDWQLDLYGEGELKEYYQQKVDSLNINIHLHAPEADIFQRYRESSMLLMTSVYEPFGLVMPEAMSCGLPVVAFDCPYGPADIVTDGVDGFLVKDRNLQVFADCVCQLIENEALRQAMGKAAIQSAQRYTADKIMPMWKQLFESVASL